MHCPICRKAVVRKGNPYRPFCSERCRLIDLDNWLSERYRVSSSHEILDRAPSAEGDVQEAERKRG
jgi:endogenous inhibitor of DNA gyrase (YacG/DUF329 family)